MSLQKPIVVVTGAGRGLGRFISLNFARAGAHVFLAARKEAELSSVAREIIQLGGSATIVPCDVGEEEDILHLKNQIERGGGKIDVLINNAGIFRSIPFLETNVDREWREIINVNLTGTFLVTFHLLPFLLKSERPHLFQMLSIAALHGYPWNAGYCASKWGARGMTEALRAEFGDRLRITNICPGATDTDIWNGSPFPNDRSKMLKPRVIADELYYAWHSASAPAELVFESPPGSVG